MRHGSLFSGIGGFDLAAEWMGWENVFHCEWNQFGQRVLKHYWPNAISYDDITKTYFTIHRGTIDIITGGFPCQPYSLAGKRKGKADERHLWPEMLRCIREVQPRYVVGENVYGLINWDGGVVFDEVQADLEAEGYEVIPVILPACAVEAPHRRERVWFVAKNTMHSGCVHRKNEQEGTEVREQRNACSRDTNGLCISEGPTPDTDQHERREGRLHEAGSKEAERYIGARDARGNAITAWNDFPTQSPVCSRNDGLSPELVGITVPKHRNESIKAYGNAIVPQVAFEIFKAIEQLSRVQN